MNSSSTPLRLVCRVVRRWSSLTCSESTNAPSGLGSRHVENCPDCQEYFGAADEFDAALRAEAATYRVTSPGLEEKVIRAVRNARPEPVERRPVRSWTPVFAGAAAAVLVAFVAHRSLENRRDAAALDLTPEELRTVVASTQAATADLWQTVRPKATALAETDPLREELGSVYTDARRAVNFLAANFLPADTLEITTDEDDTKHRG
jgi:hypothetical protein